MRAFALIALCLAACGPSAPPAQRATSRSSGPNAHATADLTPTRIIDDAAAADLAVADGVIYWVHMGFTTDGQATLQVWRKPLAGAAVQLDGLPSSREALVADESGLWLATADRLWHYDAQGLRVPVASVGTYGGPGSMVQTAESLYVESSVTPSAFGGGREVWQIAKAPPYVATRLDIPISFSRQIAVDGDAVLWSFYAFEDNCAGPCPSHGRIDAARGKSIYTVLEAAPAPAGFAVTDAGTFVRVGDEVVRAQPDGNSVPFARCRDSGPDGQLVAVNGELYCNAGGAQSSPDPDLGLWRISIDDGAVTRIDGDGARYGAMAVSDDAIFYIRDGDIWRAPLR